MSVREDMRRCPTCEVRAVYISRCLHCGYEIPRRESQGKPEAPRYIEFTAGDESRCIRLRVVEHWEVGPDIDEDELADMVELLPQILFKGDGRDAGVRLPTLKPAP